MKGFPASFAPCSAVLLPSGGGERALINAIEWELLVDGTCQGRQLSLLQQERPVSMAHITDALDSSRAMPHMMAVTSHDNLSWYWQSRSVVVF